MKDSWHVNFICRFWGHVSFLFEWSNLWQTHCFWMSLYKHSCLVFPSLCPVSGCLSVYTVYFQGIWAIWTALGLQYDRSVQHLPSLNPQLKFPANLMLCNGNYENYCLISSAGKCWKLDTSWNSRENLLRIFWNERWKKKMRKMWRWQGILYNLV